ncbi:hypothetical protein SAMN05192558_10785 [Actinokineospora alba]|uniref:Uncharacterized protein n=1 Tax=Actinokineospora alba TaxID=504798 RepID=A0A1H0QPS1_9PSEU|nr:hypothetical protein [Actinokineospora alba]TDP70456.1 hypothetical protein C8E96_6066 [Actinokineospora alba]SDI31216.1 hypothetical protein SAMN05421871_10484 [Actinokineospora alba]SDP19180.1 hypothetical protein SAMN05192558_10785 [Actinokineospora alba]
MNRDTAYRFLVPDAPRHKRTDRDPLPALDAGRIRSLNLFRALVRSTPGLADPSLVSSFSGAIKSILFAFPSFGVRSRALSSGYRSVIRALRPGTTFIVVHHESDRQTIESWFDSASHLPAHVTYVPMPDYIDFTDWAEDGYVALTDGGERQTYLLEPWTFPRSGDSLIADNVEEYSSVRASQAPLIFQGGNCLVGDDFWMLGADYFLDTLERIESGEIPVTVPPGQSQPDFVRELFGRHVDKGRTLRLVGTRRPLGIKEFYATVESGDFHLDLPAGGTGVLQPIFHIDMFITLVGRAENDRFRILVGSPALADRILGTTSPFAIQNAYDEVAAALTADGFDVVRNPLVHWPTIVNQLPFERLREFANTPDGAHLAEAVAAFAAAGAQPDSTIRVREWHHITWNNCLVENSTSVGRNVYLPTFGHGDHSDLAKLDNEMERLWTGMGFTVRLLADFNAFATRQGVVHCIKKYLHREP